MHSNNGLSHRVVPTTHLRCMGVFSSTRKEHVMAIDPVCGVMVDKRAAVCAVTGEAVGV